MGLDCFGFSNVRKDQSLTTRKAFAMVFLSPWSLEQRKYYWQPLEEMSVGMNLNLKRFCQGESDENVIFYGLKRLQIPRCFEAKTMSHKKTYEFHIFADASTFGCIQCFHLTVQNEDGNMHTISDGSSGVASLKITTEPRCDVTCSCFQSRTVPFE